MCSYYSQRGDGMGKHECGYRHHQHLKASRETPYFLAPIVALTLYMSISLCSYFSPGGGISSSNVPS